MNKKHLFLLALAVLCLVGVLHLQGCAAEYKWVRTGLPAQDYLWRKTNRAEVYRLCGHTPESFPNLGGCAFYDARICEVWSWLPEHEARSRISGDGLSLFEHEVWNESKTVGHCAGFNHGPHRAGSVTFTEEK